MKQWIIVLVISIVVPGSVFATEENANKASLFEAASMEDGKEVARKCVACHSFKKGQRHKVGPNLYNIVGSSLGKVEGYKYSKSFAEADVQWSYDNLFAFLRKPRNFIKGTKMAFPGIKEDQDIANVIYYMRSFSDEPLPLPQE